MKEILQEIWSDPIAQTIFVMSGLILIMVVLVGILKS